MWLMDGVDENGGVGGRGGDECLGVYSHVGRPSLGEERYVRVDRADLWACSQTQLEG